MTTKQQAKKKGDDSEPKFNHHSLSNAVESSNNAPNPSLHEDGTEQEPI